MPPTAAAGASTATPHDHELDADRVESRPWRATTGDMKCVVSPGPREDHAPVRQLGEVRGIRPRSEAVTPQDGEMRAMPTVAVPPPPAWASAREQSSRRPSLGTRTNCETVLRGAKAGCVGGSLRTTASLLDAAWEDIAGGTGSVRCWPPACRTPARQLHPRRAHPVFGRSGTGTWPMEAGAGGFLRSSRATDSPS